MKKSFLATLQCIGCKKNTWDLRILAEDAREIREAALTCTGCSRTYNVRGGMINMIGELPPEVAHEKEHAEAHSYLKTRDGEYPINQDTIQKFRQVFLSLPGGDGSDLFQPGGSFDNQAGNAERFYKTLELLRLTGKERVLEVGASFGWASRRFAQRGCDVTALEVSDYLQTADLYFEEDGCYFERVMADMSVLPFADESFDIIFSHSVIHHCKDLAKLFSDFRRVLKPGGRVVALHECAFGIFEDKSGKALQEAIDEGFNENAYTIPQWGKGARDGGFRKVSFHFFSFIDDYITRKTLRGARPNFKIRLARWIQARPLLKRVIEALSVPGRVLLRPKAWMIVATR